MHLRCVYAQKSPTSHPFEGAGLCARDARWDSDFLQRDRVWSDALGAGSCATHNGCVTTHARLYAPAVSIRLTATLIYSRRAAYRGRLRALSRAFSQAFRYRRIRICSADFIVGNIEISAACLSRVLQSPNAGKIAHRIIRTFYDASHNLDYTLVLFIASSHTHFLDIEYRFYSEGDPESSSSIFDPFLSLRRTILEDYHIW